MESPTRSFQLSGRTYLLIAIVIFGAANAITRKLTEIGAEHTVNGNNPISFCNVLFVGNLCALGLMITIYHDQWHKSILAQIHWRQWLIMAIVAVLGAALVPALIFTALSLTTVNNVILVGQIDIPLILILSVCLLGEQVNSWVIAGATLSFVGVALTVLLQPSGDSLVPMGFAIGRGELLTFIAAILKAISNLISKVSLKQVPLGIFSVFRLIVGTIAFFVTVVTLYTPQHFMDVASPFLWRWMLIYSAVIVVGGQLAWFSGLKRSTASEISLATAFNPIAGVLAAYLLLGEVPTQAQYIGGAIILVGIALNQIGLQHLHHTLPEQQTTKQAMAEAVGFKGI